ncbi:S9 family peptidase [Parasediminibacterium sp. JCM 36343]|uniref:S9 family peptidase n=1 Tax=Parasediminibacterium sp. JCM 36343 TaxID=3374279 RepID=UPI00397CCF45
MRKFFLLVIFLPFVVAAQTKPITLEDIYKKTIFRAEIVPGFNSMKDGRYYVETTTAGIVKKSFATGETVDTLVARNDVKDENGKPLPLSDISWSNDEKWLLVTQQKESIYRRSYKAIVYAYNIASKQAIKIDTGKIIHATFSPDATKVAFVKNNNLFYKTLATGVTVQVTKDGSWNNIINGNCDWVYEEEFSFSRAFQWSPESNYIAYYRFDESKVPLYTIPFYDSLYPTQYSYKYPKTGEANSIIEIHLYALASQQDIKADIGQETDIYIPRIQFTNNNNQLAIVRLNRLQNEMQILLADVNTGKTKTIYNEKDKYYVEVPDINFLSNGKQYLITSEKNGFNQLYLNSLDGKASVQITKGNYDIATITGIDEKNNKVYFTAAYQNAMSRDFCSVNLDGSHFKKLSTLAGTYTVAMNSNFSYCLVGYSSLNTVPTYAVTDPQLNPIRQLKNNQKLDALTKSYGFAKAEFIRVPTPKGDTLNGWMLKPANFDNAKKYPVLFCNYGGPGSQQVADKWGAVGEWHQLLAQKGYIVVCIDNTGTGYRGAAFKKKTYGQLGKYEIEDQIDAAKYLGQQPFVDAARIGHWGWSFGGFMSSLAITKGAAVFKMAIAVAPVTNWRFYDNIYTERYMGLPKDNKQGYDDNAPMNFVDKIKGKFLIIHGTADDNVHFQNSAMMIDEMIKKNIEFESGYYPNKNHSIFGGNTRLHLYTKMTKFILDNL